MVGDRSFDHELHSGEAIVQWLIKDGAANNELRANVIGQALCTSGILVPTHANGGTGGETIGSKRQKQLTLEKKEGVLDEISGGCSRRRRGELSVVSFAGSGQNCYTLSHVPVLRQEALEKEKKRGLSPRTAALVDAFMPGQGIGANAGDERSSDGELVQWEGFLKVSRKDFISASEYHFGPTFVVLTTARLLHHKVCCLSMLCDILFDWWPPWPTCLQYIRLALDLVCPASIIAVYHLQQLHGRRQARGGGIATLPSGERYTVPPSFDASPLLAGETHITTLRSIDLSKKGNGRFVALMDDNVWCYTPIIQVGTPSDSLFEMSTEHTFPL